MKKYIGYVIAAAAFAAAGVFFRTALRGYGFLALVMFGISALVLVFMGLRLMEKRRPRVSRAVRKTLNFLIVAGLVVLIGTEIFIISAESGSVGVKADYAIVLGAGVNGTVPSRSLQARLVSAKEYAETYPDAVLIVSGGKGGGENVSEARCMYDWLTANGVDGGRIIMEDRASTTAENIAFSKAIIENREPGYDGTVCIITENFHVCRALIIARDNGLTAFAKGAYTGLPVLNVNYHLREAAAIWYYGLFGRS